MARSWVARGKPWVGAVATINRSAGSPWKLWGQLIQRQHYIDIQR
jgi:hypothetical protein